MLTTQIHRPAEPKSEVSSQYEYYYSGECRCEVTVTREPGNEEEPTDGTEYEQGISKLLSMEGVAQRDFHRRSDSYREDKSVGYI